jgi:DNA-binding winged helix-turn-helix (wHTH) protein
MKGGADPMLPPPTTARLIRFGPFEVDPKSRELFSQGLRIQLQEQPFRILSMLLEHRGEVVTREELCEALWPGDTFVDFDQGLNKAINKIRSALGDSPERPRYIETLPKRGYRLIVPVNRANQDRQSSNGPGEAKPRTIANSEAGGLAQNSRLWHRTIRIGAKAVLKPVLATFGLGKLLPE